MFHAKEEVITSGGYSSERIKHNEDRKKIVHCETVSLEQRTSFLDSKERTLWHHDTQTGNAREKMMRIGNYLGYDRVRQSNGLKSENLFYFYIMMMLLIEIDSMECD